MENAFDSELAARVEASGVAAVLVVDDVADAVPLAKALLDGGIDVMELTLRTDAGLAALAEIRSKVPEMIAGAGTVLSVEQLRAVHQAGASFAVAPGTNPRVLTEARKLDFSFAPGICTPSDIETALEFDCKLLKFFPAEPSGGLSYLKSMAAPYMHLNLKYVPLGGLNADNMTTYLAEKIVAALGGSWIAPRPAIQKHDWKTITANAAAAAAAVKKTRSDT